MSYGWRFAHIRSLFEPSWVSGKTAYSYTGANHHSTMCYKYAMIVYVIHVYVQWMLEINSIILYILGTRYMFKMWTQNYHLS